MPVKIFFCYAHEDELFLNKLKAHLKPLQRQGLIDVWYDRDISAGVEWELEIKEHLEAAQIILLLISPDFMNSDYCYSIEVKRAIERHDRKEAEVIPIILRPVYWQGEPLGKLQALPTDAKPVVDWSDQDEAFLSITNSILKLMRKLSMPSVSPSPEIIDANPHDKSRVPTLHVSRRRVLQLGMGAGVAVIGIGGIYYWVESRNAATPHSTPKLTPTLIPSLIPTPVVDVVDVFGFDKPFFSQNDLLFKRVPGRLVDFTIYNTQVIDEKIFYHENMELINVTRSDGSPITTSSFKNNVTGVISTIYTIPSYTSVNIFLVKLIETHLYLTASDHTFNEEYTSELTIHPTS